MNDLVTVYRVYRIFVANSVIGTILAAVDYADTSVDVTMEYLGKTDNFVLTGSSESFADLLVCLRDAGVLLELSRFVTIADLICAEIEAEDMLRWETSQWN